jgi:trans-aconitate methyltransferase
MKWNAELYKNNHNYSTQYGQALLDYLPESFEVALDIGCGTGDLTNLLSKRVTKRTVGLDSSADMLALAKKNYPHIDFILGDATKLTFNKEFDVVFSNACFHWIKEQKALLSGIYNALKVGGTLVCEFGFWENCKLMVNSFANVTGIKNDKFFYPTEAEYRELLEDAGLNVVSIEDFPRPTPLKDGKDGLRKWYKQFYIAELATASEEEQNAFFEKIERELSKELFDENENSWIADYWRIRVKAERKNLSFG